MIKLKNSEQLEIMKIAGRITGEALYLAGEAVKEGVTTHQIDKIVRTHIEKCGAKPSFLGYGGFPGSACIYQLICRIPCRCRSRMLFEESAKIIGVKKAAFASHLGNAKVLAHQIILCIKQTQGISVFHRRYLKDLGEEVAEMRNAQVAGIGKQLQGDLLVPGRFQQVYGRLQPCVSGALVRGELEPYKAVKQLV